MYELVAYARHGAAGDGDLAFLLLASATANIPLPPFGTLFLDPTSLVAQRIEAIGQGGTVKSVSQGCGNGGIAGASGPFAVGNPQFAFTLTRADPGAVIAALALAVPGPTFACGSCKLILGVVYVQVPIASGSAALPIAVPCEGSLVGATLQVQWVTFGGRASPCPILPAFSASDVLEATVGG